MAIWALTPGGLTQQPANLYEGFAEVESGSNTTITDPKLAEFGDDFFKGATVWVNAAAGGPAKYQRLPTTPGTLSPLTAFD